MQQPFIYLDYNATTPCDPEVVKKMLPFFSEYYGNASSPHPAGWQAKNAVAYAREQVAALIGAGESEIIFTSGATEAINLAVKGVAAVYKQKGKHIITISTEHKAVLDTLASLEKENYTVTYLPVDKNGEVNLQTLQAAIQTDTILICAMYANNETGIIHPVKTIGKIAKEHNIIFFCDATQAIGKIPVNVIEDNIDLLCLSAHKIYGPKGAGALYIRRRNPRVTLLPLIDGGGHEKGLRSGTLNVPGIVGMGAAAAIAREKMEQESLTLETWRNWMENELSGIAGCFINSRETNRLPNTTNISFKHIDGNVLMAAAVKKVAVASGSACTAASMHPSHVLTAMGLGRKIAQSTLRLSLGRFTTWEEVKKATTALQSLIHSLRDAGEMVSLQYENLPETAAEWFHPLQ